MPSSTITSKGQITIPKEVRDTSGLEAGQKVTFWLREDGVIEMRPENLDVMSLYGILKPKVKGVTIEDMKEAVRKAAAGK